MKKRQLTRKEKEEHKSQIEVWSVDTLVLEAEIMSIKGQLKDIDLAMKAKISGLKVELASLLHDLNHGITKRQLQKALKMKEATLERVKLNIKALRHQIKEGIVMPEGERKAPKESEEVQDSQDEAKEEE